MGPAATSTLTESNISSTKGTTKKVTIAEVPPLRSEVSAPSSRSTPNQDLKAHEERNCVQHVRKVAYALKNLVYAKNCESAEQMAREASLKFNV